MYCEYVVSYIYIYHIYQTVSHNAGRLNANVAPFPSGLFSAHILPPCASTIFLETYSPNPRPSEEVVANFVKSFGKMLAA